MSNPGPFDFHQSSNQTSQGQSGIGTQLTPEVKFNIFQAISNFSKVFNRIELGRLAQKFEQPIESIISLAEEWVSSGLIFGQIIGRDLIISKINVDERQFRQMVLGQQIDYQFATTTNPQDAVPQQPELDYQQPIVFGETGDQTQEIQEKSISADVDLSFIAGFCRLKFTVANASSAKISDVIVKMSYPKSLRLVQVKPTQYLKRQEGVAIIMLPVITAHNGASIIFYFKPLEVEKYLLKGAIQFTNARDFVRMVAVDTLQFDIPIIKFNAGNEITPEYIEKFVQSCETRGIRSFGLPEKISPQAVFVHLKQLLKSYNLQFVTESQSDQMLAAWYIGKDVDSGKEYVAAGQVYNKKIEFYISGPDEKAIIGLLTDFGQKIRARMLSSHVINNPQEFIELMCPYCGGTLESLPQTGENITCKWCQGTFLFNPSSYL